MKKQLLATASRRLLGVLLLAVLGCLLLGSCAAHRPVVTTPPPRAEAIARDTTTIQPPPTRLDKLLGRTPKPRTYVGPTLVTAGKRSTITIYAAGGNQTNTTSTVGKKGTAATGENATAAKVEKAKAPVAVKGEATDQRGATNAATVKGNNNTLRQQAVPPAPKLTRWQKLKQGFAVAWQSVRLPLLALGSLAGVAALVCWLAPTSAVGAWLLAIWKRRSTSQPQT